MSQLILPKDVDSKFRFITVAAQRAKQLQNGAKPRVETRSRKATRIAVEETARRDGVVGGAGQAPAPRRYRAARGGAGGRVPMAVVLGVTGCIGAYKACEVLRELQRRGRRRARGDDGAATRFVSADDVRGALAAPGLPRPVRARRGGRDPAHQPRRRRPTLLLVAPATANILGKFAHGIADDALSTLYLATRAPVLVAPAMNVNMFEHPAVQREPGDRCARGAWASSSRARATSPAAGSARAAWPRCPRSSARRWRVLRARRDLEGETRPGDGRAHGRGHRPGALRLQSLQRARWATASPRPHAIAARA